MTSSSMSSIQQLTSTLAVVGLLALGVTACASHTEPIGESEQPISGDGSDACADGVAPSDAVAGQCTITARGLCFASREAACACAGCALDDCAIGESFPEQAFCPSSGGGSNPDQPVSDDADHSP